MRAWRLGAAIINSRLRLLGNMNEHPAWRMRKAEATVVGVANKHKKVTIFGLQRLRSAGYTAPRRRSLRDVAS